MATEMLILATAVAVTSSSDVTMSDVKIKALFDKKTDGICFPVIGLEIIVSSKYGTPGTGHSYE